VALSAALLERSRWTNQRRQCLPRRQGSVVATITKALEMAGGPMQAREIHAAAEDILKATISHSSAKEALSAHARGSNPRFRRIRHGLYELAR
jgi:hypothetical protein